MDGMNVAVHWSAREALNNDMESIQELSKYVANESKEIMKEFSSFLPWIGSFGAFGSIIQVSCDNELNFNLVAYKDIAFVFESKKGN